jgi:hypothetical protein
MIQIYFRGRLAAHAEACRVLKGAITRADPLLRASASGHVLPDDGDPGRWVVFAHALRDHINLYFAHCAHCRWSAAAYSTRALARRIETASLQATAPALPEGTGPEEATEAAAT